MERAASGGVKFAFCLGGNLFGSNPDAAFATKAINSIDTVIYLNTTLNTGHVHGRGRETIILPVLARDEEPQPTTQESMFNYVRLSDGGPPRLEGPRAEIDVIAAIAELLFESGGAVDWRSMREYQSIRHAISKIIPGYEKIGEIDATKKEFQIAGRTFHQPVFPTDTGRARFHVVPIPENGTSLGRGELRLMTVRSEGQFNTVVYEEEDIYRGQDRRDVFMMNPRDIAKFGLNVDQRVTVRSALRRTDQRPRPRHRHRRRLRGYVLSRSQRARAQSCRPTIEDAGVQKHARDDRSRRNFFTAIHKRPRQRPNSRFPRRPRLQPQQHAGLLMR